MNSRQANLQLAVRHANEAPAYEAALQILLDAGVRLFGLEIPSRTVYYNSDLDAYVERGEPFGHEPAAAGLDPNAIRAAMLATHAGSLDSDGFIHRLWHAGVTEYYLNLLVGTITYRGRNGETFRDAVAEGETLRLLMPRV
jgi:uncharacterized protein YbcV (DUF1398 family)